MSRVTHFYARVVGTITWIKVSGREAQTLHLLITRGRRGFTSGEASPLGWARRTSAYIHGLRDLGFPIETLREMVGDAAVGRYRLTAKVEIRRTDGSAEGVPW